MCLSVSIKEAWPMCLSVSVKDTWPVYLSVLVKECVQCACQCL